MEAEAQVETANEAAVSFPEFATEITIPNEWMRDRADLIKRAAGVQTIASTADADEAGGIMSRLSKHSSKLDKQRLALTKPFREAQTKIKALCDDWRNGLEAEKHRLQGLLTDYAREQRAKEEAERRRQEQAVREEAERQVAETGAVNEQTLPPQTEVVPETVYGTRIVKRLQFTVTDKSILPKSFLMPDEQAIRRWMSTDERKGRIMESLEIGVQPIPGIEFRIETVAQAR